MFRAISAFAAIIVAGIFIGMLSAQDTQPTSQPDAKLTSEALKFPPNKDGELCKAEISADGKLMVFTYYHKAHDDADRNKLLTRIQDIKTGQITYLTDLFPPEILKGIYLYEVSFSPNGHMLLVRGTTEPVSEDSSSPPKFDMVYFAVDPDQKKVRQVHRMEWGNAIWAGDRILLQSLGCGDDGFSKIKLTKPLTDEVQELPIYGRAVSASSNGDRLLIIADPEKLDQKISFEDWEKNAHLLLTDGEGKVLRKLQSPEAGNLLDARIVGDGKYAYIRRSIDEKTVTELISLSDGTVKLSIKSRLGHVIVLADDSLLTFDGRGIYRVDKTGNQEKLCSDQMAMHASASGRTLIYETVVDHHEFQWRMLKLPIAVK